MSALLVAVALVSAPVLKEPPAVETTAQKVKELQKERIATLKSAADVSFELAKHGRLETGEALEDRMALLRAEVEAAEKESDRVALYVKVLESLNAYEKLAQLNFKSGRGTEREVHKTKARRLEVQIWLEKAKLKEAQEKK